MAATASDAPASTNSPVMTAAAGRSQPSQPARPGSGLNRSTTAATAAGNQSRGGSWGRHHGLPWPVAAEVHQLSVRRADCLEAILARI
jgi:hypothetical protein